MRRRTHMKRSRDLGDDIIPLERYCKVRETLFDLIEEIELHPFNKGGIYYNVILGSFDEIDEVKNSLKAIAFLIRNYREDFNNLLVNAEGRFFVREKELECPLSIRELEETLVKLISKYNLTLSQKQTDVAGENTTLPERCRTFKNLSVSHHNAITSYEVICAAVIKSSEGKRTGSGRRQDGEEFDLFGFGAVAKLVAQYLGKNPMSCNFYEHYLSRQKKMHGVQTYGFRHWKLNFDRYYLDLSNAPLELILPSVTDKRFSFDETKELLDTFPCLINLKYHTFEQVVKDLWLKKWRPCESFKQSVTTRNMYASGAEQLEDIAHSVREYFIEHPEFNHNLFQCEYNGKWKDIFLLLEQNKNSENPVNNYYFDMMLEECIFVRDCVPYLTSYQEFRYNEPEKALSYFNYVPREVVDSMQRFLNHPLYTMMIRNLLRYGCY